MGGGYGKASWGLSDECLTDIVGAFQEEVVVLPSAPLAPVSAIVSGSDYVPVTFTWLSP